jgi:flagellar motor protein MotB
MGAVVWKLAFAPRRAAEQAREEELREQEAERSRQEKMRAGGTDSRYKHTVDVRLDAFSGYALIRSEFFKRELGNKSIKILIKDDEADYLDRIKALESGDADMAVFTIDALIKVCSEIGRLPATIVAVIDETTGADAIVAYKAAIPNVDALNRAETRFVLTPNSPSETLARVVMSRFDLVNLTDQPFVEVGSAEEVVQRYSDAKPGDPYAYVLWEPYVSQMLQNEAIHVVVDSSRFPSSIVDVIVAGDDFAQKKPEVIKQFVESYLRTVYEYRERSDLVKLVMDDARQTGAPVSEEQAAKLVDGIWWKNTQENLAHFGLLPERGLRHIEDMIGTITEVLASTGGIDRDPTEGHPNYLFQTKILEELKDFHPGEESIREVALPALSDSQWEQLTTVGTARVPEIAFARGTARLTEHSKAVLDHLAENLATTRFYVVIRGNASLRGSLEQNKILAQQRAKVAEEYLIEHGVDANRIRAIGVEPSGKIGVSFVLGQLPY